MLDAATSGLAPPTLRLYRWSSVAVSVGRFQSIARTVDAELCRTLGVPVVRRPTGGRGVLHGGDQTLSIAARRSHLGAGDQGIIATYRALLEGLVHGLRALNVSAAPPPAERRSEHAGDCFAVRSAADLVAADGSKLAGAAMRQRAGAVLLQASVVHQKPQVDSGRVFLGTPACLRYPLEHIDPSAVEQAVVDGYRHTLGVPLHEGELTGWELERAGVLLARYAAVGSGSR